MLDEPIQLLASELDPLALVGAVAGPLVEIESGHGILSGEAEVAFRVGEGPGQRDQRGLDRLHAVAADGAGLLSVALLNGAPIRCHVGHELGHCGHVQTVEPPAPEARQRCIPSAYL